MPRRRRVVRPNALIHVIVRFLNNEFLLDSDEERAEYLRRAATCFEESDWKILSYALMSSHTHFSAIAGDEPFGDLSRRLHAGFAGWLNPRRRRLGPVVANRPTIKELPIEAAGRLIAYHHNNPVRAGVVRRARDSSWTSQRRYMFGEEKGWVHVELGLRLAGFELGAFGRQAFAEFVETNVEARDDLSIESASARKDVRTKLGPSIELGSARLEASGLEAALLMAPEGAVIRDAFCGSIEQAIGLVANALDMSPEVLCSRSRVRAIAHARRLAVLCCHTLLDRTITEVAAALGISASAARKLERTASPAALQRAKQMTSRIRQVSLGTCSINKFKS